MKIIEIYENESLKLDETENAELINIKSSEHHLPFDIIDGKFITDAYIIGEVQLENTLIRIKPRHDALNLSLFFEMLLYINNLSESSLTSSSYSYKKAFGVDSLLENFIDYCEVLISFGLTGVFNQIISNSHMPSGKINFDNYKKQLIPIEGVVVEKEKYELDSNANQILKAALSKINTFQSLGKSNAFRVKSLLSNFEGINEYQMDSQKIRNDIENTFSPNQLYPICLEYAAKILLDFRLGYDCYSNFQWNAFLENSNDIFEKYVRRILERELNNSVTKWSIPKAFAEIEFNGIKGIKAYTPDVLIDFKNDTARAVFDAKNKNFNPLAGTLSDLVSVADIYQLEFYANQLNSNVCGLIYPAKGNFDPIELELKGIDKKFFLVSIDMSAEFKTRNSTFVKNIEKCLFYT